MEDDTNIPVRAAGLPRIHLLPEEVRSRIAAGEVIERPASVLKELVENSLDAGAGALHVQIEGGGRELVRLADDGCGMDAADLALAVCRHATSKLSSADDLYVLTTLGFRGEALPAIGSVSRMVLISRPPHSDQAWRLEVQGGAVGQVAAAAGSPGTIVEVRELFYNLPARRKFLKGQGPEAAACTEMFVRLALARPDVAFTLTQGRQEILSCPPVAAHGLRGGIALQAYVQRARDALGRSATEDLAPVSAALLPRAEAELAAPAPPGAWPPRPERLDAPYRLTGLLCRPDRSRPNRSQIYLAVNGRPVRDRTLTTALLEAYRQWMPARRFPAGVLFLELPRADVDINVHPTKAEVRFRFPNLIFSLFHQAVREAFGAAPVAPEAGVSQAPSPAPARPPGAQFRPPAAAAPPAFDLWQGEREAPVRMPGLSLSGEAPAAYGAPVVLERPGAAPAVRPQPVPERPALRTGPASGPPAAPVAAQASAAFRVLGQAGGAYIVIEDAEGVKVLDQHAVHERVLFEELQRNARQNARADSQRLLLPENVELTPAQAAALSDPEAHAALHELGYELAEFGPRAVVVHAVPAALKGQRAPALVAELLDVLTGAADGSARAPSRVSLREKAAYILACKGAIKAGDRLSVEQMAALVSQFRRCAPSLGATCPHGRPVAVDLSWDELERRVGRA
jgi:DNA mismatch repair protein MutL